MDRRSYALAVGIVLATCTGLGALTYGDYVYGALLELSLAVAGVCVGTGLFQLGSRFLGNRPIVRPVCAVASLLLAAVVGFWLGFTIYRYGNLSRLEAGQRLATLNRGVTALSGSILSGFIGTLFGAGLGQRAGRD